jgi:hypothetical protein
MCAVFYVVPIEFIDTYYMDTGPLMVESKKSKVHLGIELHQEKEKVF